MSDSQGYNGWANYPTWCVNLWLGNEQGLYEEARERTSREVDTAADSPQVLEGIWTLEQARRFNTADSLKDMVEEITEYDGASIRTDLFGYALALVDWNEIAEHWIADEIESRQYA